MATIDNPPFDVPELVRILKGVDPNALLVSARVLRRVIQHGRHLGGLSLAVPHRKSCVIDSEELLKIADPDELGIEPDQGLPARVILLVKPEPERLARSPIDQALFKYWRMLFHARLDLAMVQKIADGSLDSESVKRRILRLGSTEFDEIGMVMGQEKFLLPPETEVSVYAEFVAVYLTLRHFTPHLLPHFFPCLRDLESVDALLAEDVDVNAVFEATRPPGAPAPEQVQPRITQADLPEPTAIETAETEPEPPIGGKSFRRLQTRAQEMDARGNNVRAAILRATAAQRAKRPLTGAAAELSRLSQRLQRALELSSDATEQWRRALLPLLASAARGAWSQEARFLYDLQKACIDSERGIFTIDLIEWARTFGRRPIKRPLPGHQQVAIVRHLRQAMDRLRYVRLANDERQQLAILLDQAVEHRERLMRQRFRPLIATAMNEVGMKPQNVPEELGRAKLIEELLDRVVDYGHLNMGNLRDAISRNQLKLPDLRGPRELILGDSFIRLNRRFSVSLDGVYRRGEFYMRLLHRISSAAFGTATGRMLMLFLVLPFGLAFLTMVTPGLLAEEGARFGRRLGLIERPIDAAAIAANAVPNADDAEPDPFPDHAKLHEHRPLTEMADPVGVIAFGVFYLFLFHVGSFRNTVFGAVFRVCQGLHRIFVQCPLWLLQLPLFKAVLNRRVWLILRRCVLWPLAMALVGGLMAWLWDLEPLAIAWTSAGWWLACIVLLNSRIGRDLEEGITDRLVYFWLVFSVDFVPGLLRLIMDVSRSFLETVEQGIYTVDEWLRFKSGEGAVLLATKAVLSVIWFAVTYVVRIYINLLAEPTLNPIKHFPVVTLGHKIMLPFLLNIRRFFYYTLGFYVLGPVMGNGVVLVTIFFLPGICGFAVWELKENWKLYRANRPRNLKPQMIGSHGETMLRLLRMGFHSGTIPKQFRKLRRAERRGQARTTRKILASLHHVDESIAHFIQRELLALLRQSNRWGGQPIELASVHLATDRVTMALSCPELGARPLVLAIDLESGCLVGCMLEAGWLPKLTQQQRQTLAAALAGFYQMAGVASTREQIAAGVEPMPVSWQEWVWTWDGDKQHANGDQHELGAGLLPSPLKTR